MDAVVVGGGFAGMAAARALERGGARVTVLEARERVGGRVWSTTMGDGVVVERGGEFIFDGYETLERHVDELGLELVRRGFTYADRRPIGDGAGRREDLAAVAARMADHRAARAAAGDAGSMADVFATTDVSEPDRALLTARFTIGLGWRLDQISERWPAPQQSVDGHSEFVVPRWVRGGNQRIAERIAEELAGEVRLRSAALAVDQDERGVTVHVADGTTVRADSVIVAVPLPILRRLVFTPALPADKADAYARMGVGDITKLHVSLAERVTPDAIQDLDVPFWAYTPSEHDGRSSVVGAAAGGSEHRERLAIDTRDPHTFRQRLAAAWPELQLADEMLLTPWMHDPWARGAYTFHPVAWSDDAERALSAPLGRIAFAGEHASEEQTIDGVMRSGIRAAQEVLAL